MAHYELGPVTLDWIDGDLRYLCVGGYEVLRRVYGAVRDERWGTVPAEVTLLTEEFTANRLHLVWRSEHRQGDCDFVWQGTLYVAVTHDAAVFEVAVYYGMNGTARSSFRTNRTGLCVLQPLVRLAGAACELVHPDGRIEDSRFPLQVAPHQPFTDLVGLRWLTRNRSARLRFEGEVFETEDQRNWSDGSFKTYSRPLSRPYPYELTAGDVVPQAVWLEMAGPGGIEPTSDHSYLFLGGPIGPLPPLGLRLAAGTSAPVPADFLRVDLHLAQACELPAPPLLPVELGLHLPANGEADLAPIAAWMQRARVLRVIVYRDGQPLASAGDVALVSAALGEDVLIGAGTVGSFAELNRNAQSVGEASLLAWPICPQVHATDDLSLIENLQGQAATVKTARAAAPHAHLAVGPLLFWRRPDPFAAGNSGTDDGNAPPDPRLRAALGAAWTLASIRELAEAGADSITLYDVAGPYGVEGSPLEPLLRALVGGGELLSCTAVQPLSLAGLAVRRDGKVIVFVANLQPIAVEVAVVTGPSRQRTVALAPYEVATIEESVG